MKRSARTLLAAATAMLFSAHGWSAPVFTFSTPTLPLPAASGTGLTGQLWTNVAPSTDSLAATEAIIAGGFATANFLSTTIDYPSGPTGSTVTSATYDAVLDATAKATLDNSSVLPDDVLNTAMRFAGFFGVKVDGEEWTFRILSDDGSAVDIQGTRILNNDGIHGFGGPSTTVLFEKAGLYALDVLFFESQVSHWGLEFAGGLTGTGLTTDLTDRLYNLIDYAAPTDDRLDTIRPTGVPVPSTLPLLGAGLWGLFAVAARQRRKQVA